MRTNPNQSSLNITAEPFAVHRALGQARAAEALVKENASWLRNSPYSGVLKRYRPAAYTSGFRETVRERLKGPHNIARFAFRHPDVQAYLLKANTAENLSGGNPFEEKTRQVIGMGTLIANQTIVHPVSGESISGLDIDYWLDDWAEYAGRPHIHEDVARVLLDNAEQFADKSQVSHAFATTQPGKAHQPHGLTALMSPAGPSQPLQMAEASPYDITKGGVDL